jgi:nucleotide-binding universal stress UspA family protein
MFKKILLCTDGSDRSLEAARLAAKLAQLHGSALIALHVGNAPSVDETFPGAPMIAQPMLEQYMRDLHRAVLARTVNIINEYGVYCEPRSTEGDPVFEINKLAEAEDVDLIVIGTRGLTVSNAARMGSVSYGIAHSAPCPVLLAR